MASGWGDRSARRASAAMSSAFKVLARRDTISSCMSNSVGRRLVEAFGPHMASGLGVGQLRIQAKAVAAALNRAFQYVAYV